MLEAARMALALAVSMFAAAGFAQSGFPNKALRVMVPYGPGGNIDIIARVVGQKLSEQIAQPVIIENRPGANGNIAAAAASKASPDGYTILMGNLSMMVHNAHLYSGLTYNPRDFVPVSLAAETVMMVKVHSDSQFKTLKDLIEFGRANPGKLNFGSVGNGSVTHLPAELFCIKAGIQAVHIPFNSGAQTQKELLARRIDFLVEPAQLKSGSPIRALAVLSETRRKSMPEVPTVAEAGLPNFQANSWIAYFVPKGTPADIVAKLNFHIDKVLELAEVRQKIGEFGMDIRGSTADELARMIERDEQIWAPIIKAVGVKID